MLVELRKSTRRKRNRLNTRDTMTGIYPPERPEEVITAAEPDEIEKTKELIMGKIATHRALFEGGDFEQLEIINKLLITLKLIISVEKKPRLRNTKPQNKTKNQVNDDQVKFMNDLKASEKLANST